MMQMTSDWLAENGRYVPASVFTFIIAFAIMSPWVGESETQRVAFALGYSLLVISGYIYGKYEGDLE